MDDHAQEYGSEDDGRSAPWPFDLLRNNEDGMAPGWRRSHMVSELETLNGTLGTGQARLDYNRLPVLEQRYGPKRYTKPIIRTCGKKHNPKTQSYDVADPPSSSSSEPIIRKESRVHRIIREQELKINELKLKHTALKSKTPKHKELKSKHKELKSKHKELKSTLAALRASA